MYRKNFPNTAFIKTKLNKETIDKLNNYIKNKKNKWNNKLAGNLSKSYAIKDKNDWFFKNVLLKLLNEYEQDDIKAIVPSILTKHCQYVLNSFWVNFQKKTRI